MRLRIKRREVDADTPEEPGAGSERAKDGARVSHRSFMKLVGAAVGAGVVAPLVAPATPALADQNLTPNVGIGLTPATTLDVAGTVRSTAQLVPTSGQGTEIIYYNGVGFVGAYDRTNNQALPLSLNFWSGNVGVGTMQPATLLDVNGMIQTEGMRMNINGFDGSPGYFWFRTTASEPGSVFLAFQASAGGNALAVLIAPQANVGVYVNSSGQVGIGTTSPNAQYRMDVNGSMAVADNVGGNTNRVYLASGDNNHFIYSTGNTGNQMYIGEYAGNFHFLDTSSNTDVVTVTGGKVGIGAPSPSATLHLGSGSIQVGSTKIADANGSYYS